MNNDDNILTVNIFGTEYPLKSTANVKYVQRVAAYVDAKMKDIQKAKPTRALHQIAILAAMNIADELLQQREVEINDHQDFEEKISSLSTKLEQGIIQLIQNEQ